MFSTAPRRSCGASSAAITAAPAHAAGTLVGWASMPANTPSEGPTTGQFGINGFGANGILLPVSHGQAVQGFSAVLPGPTAQSFYVMPDNGFGTQGNSADALLRVYAVQPDFRTWSGKAVVGAGTVLGIIFFVLAAVMLATSVVSFCPLYRLVGVSTCKTGHRGGMAA